VTLPPSSSKSSKPGEQAEVGTIVRLRKAHPCGGFTWRIFRLETEVGLECKSCGRHVLLSREEFMRRCVRLEDENSI